MGSERQDESSHYLDAAKALFEGAFSGKDTRMTPCTPEDVATLESKLSLDLPAAYREFLFWMGRASWSFWKNRNAFCWDLPDNQEWARELMRTVGDPRVLPRTAVVFYWDVSQSFFFFDVADGPNPPVFHYADPGLEELFRENFSINDIESGHQGQRHWRYLWEDRNAAEYVLRSPTFSQFMEDEVAYEAYVIAEAEKWEQKAKETRERHAKE